jgi:hypothetical protein
MWTLLPSYIVAHFVLSFVGCVEWTILFWLVREQLQPKTELVMTIVGLGF